MAFKTLLAAGFAALTLAFAPVPQAEAKTNVHIGIGIGTGGWVDPCWGNSGRRCGWRPRPHYFYYVPRHRPLYYYDDDRYDYVHRPVRHRLTCHAARNLVDRSGFNSVRTRECRGEVYTFRARKKGHNYVVKVNAYSRRIVAVSRY